MEESTYETFEDELGMSLQEEPPVKPVRQIRRADVQTSRKVKEEPPKTSQTIPKPAQRETSREMSTRQALPIQNLSQMESPWEGITLNRCLFVAITVLLISFGFQRLHETLKSLRAGEDGGRGRVEGDGGEREDILDLRHGGLKQDSIPPQPESSLWDSLFWWVMEEEDDEDEDEDEEEENMAGTTGMKGMQGASRRAKHQDMPGSAGRKREKRKEKRVRGRELEEEQEEGGMRKRGREERETVKQWEEEEGERLRKKQKKSMKQERLKGSGVTKVTE